MKLKINSKVVPSKKCLKFYWEAGTTIYEVPGTGQIRPRDLADICYWRAAQLGYLGVGRIKKRGIDEGKDMYYVHFKSKFGETSAWFYFQHLEPTATYRKPKSE